MGYITSSLAKEYRLQEWAALIKECMNRPKGMKVIEWYNERNISKDTYYYWFAKARQACLDARKLKIHSDTNSSSIVPIPRELITEPSVSEDAPATLDISAGNYVIHVNESTTKELLSMVLKVSANI